MLLNIFIAYTALSQTSELTRCAVQCIGEVVSG